jgi:hypothetical protein
VDADRLAARRALARLVTRMLVTPDEAGGFGAVPDPSGLRVPWPALRWAAISERVVPALATAVADGVLDVEDDHVLEIADLWGASMTNCLQVEAGLLWLGGELADRGIEMRVLKGPAAAHLDHRRPEHRQFGDLDVLIRSEDLQTVFEMLGRAGFERRYPEPRRGFDERYTKSVSFRGEIEIDVHRTLAEGPVGHRIVVDDLWGQAERFDVAGTEFDALPAALRFTHACLHAHLAAPPVRLSSMSDIGCGLTRGTVDMAEVIEVAERWQLAAIVHQSVLDAVATLWWPDHVDPGWMDAPPESVVEAALVAAHRQQTVSSAARALLSAITVPRGAGRVRYVADLAMPSTGYTADRHRSATGRIAHAWRQLVALVRPS